jgi:hypothetical protein
MRGKEKRDAISKHIRFQCNLLNKIILGPTFLQFIPNDISSLQLGIHFTKLLNWNYTSPATQTHLNWKRRVPLFLGEVCMPGAESNKGLLEVPSIPLNQLLSELHCGYPEALPSSRKYYIWIYQLLQELNFDDQTCMRAEQQLVSTWTLRYLA